MKRLIAESAFHGLPRLFFPPSQEQKRYKKLSCTTGIGPPAPSNTQKEK
jgi:hypothetical protein